MINNLALSIKFISLVLTFFLISCTPQTKAPDSIKLIEKINQTDEKITINYEKYKLNNGLTLLLHQDNTIDTVEVNITYNVGSKNEELGKTGFAHFFEHMMFQGSKNVGDDQHFKIVTQAGGSLNGSTSKDITNYYQTIPYNHLEKILWLESDRMGFMLETMNQEKFKIQQDTVLNERLQRVDNQPYGRVYEYLSQAFYPTSHPYYWPTIGFLDDIKNYKIDDLKYFFEQYYNPNNATLTIGGNFNTKETLELVDKYFSDLKNSNSQINNKKISLLKEKSKDPTLKKSYQKTSQNNYPNIKLSKNRYISYLDNIANEMLYFKYPSSKIATKEEAALDYLTSILFNGTNSYFYEKLVSTNLINQISGYNSCLKLSCSFDFYVLLNENNYLNKINKILEKEINNLDLKKIITAEKIKKEKTKYNANTVYRLDNLANRVNKLALYETFYKNPNYLQEQIKIYNSITYSDIKNAYDKYIKNKNKVVLRVLKNSSNANSLLPKDNFFIKNSTELKALESPQTSQITNKEIKLTEKINKKSLDRSINPQSKKVTFDKKVSYKTDFLDNDKKIKMHFMQEEKLPITQMIFTLDFGYYFDEKQKQGLANLTSLLLDQSTKKSTKEEIQNKLDALGSEISFNLKNNNLKVTLRSLSKNIQPTIALLFEKLNQPAFLLKEFITLKNQIKARIKYLDLNNKNIAHKALLDVLYKDNYLSNLKLGTIKTLDNIEINDLENFYIKNIKNNISSVSVISSISKKDILELLKKNIKTKNNQHKKLIKLDNKYSNQDRAKIFLVQSKSKAQSTIKIIKPSSNYSYLGRDFYKKLANYPLGGHFNSRLNMNLREDKGFTYGINSSFNSDKFSGYFSISTNVNTKDTANALFEILDEIDSFYTEGVLQTELSFLKESILQSRALENTTIFSKLVNIDFIENRSLPKNYVAKQNKKIKNLTIKEINQLVQNYFDIDTMQIIVVGDIESIKDDFELFKNNKVQLNIL